MRARQGLLERFTTHWVPPAHERLQLLLSGGGDSTALFFLLLAAGYPFRCWHFHHDSPGAFAGRSAEFCQELCGRHGVDLHLRPLNASGHKALGDLSWQAAASRLRYQEIAQASGVFLTAHTADDQAETILMRLLDGAGLAGLAGIRANREGRILRPLLPFRRHELRHFLQELGQQWLDDPSNLGGNARARLRHQLLPALESYSPSFVTTMVRTADTLACDEQALTDWAREWLKTHNVEGDHWPLKELRSLPSAVRHRVFREIWRMVSDGSRRPLGGVFRECDRLVEQGGDDRKVIFPGGHSLRRMGSWLWLEPHCEAIPWSVPLLEPPKEPWNRGSWVLLPAGNRWEDGQETWLRISLPAGVFKGEKQYEIRSRRPGDVYRGRSLKKLLATTGQPPWVRDRWPLLACGQEIVALPGFGTGLETGENGYLLFKPQAWRWRVTDWDETISIRPNLEK